MSEETTKIAALVATAGIEDGRVAMSGRAADATLYVRRHEALADVGPVVTLVVAGEDLAADVELDRDGLEALREALAGEVD